MSSNNGKEFLDRAAMQAAQQGGLTPEQAQEMIFGDGPKPFRYEAVIKKNDQTSQLITRWEFEVPNGLIVGWLRKEDLQNLLDTCRELLEEMENPAQQLSIPPGLIVPGQQ